jgi:hypothetical protein
MEKCHICAERKQLIKELISQGKKQPYERRNAGLDAFDSQKGCPIPGSGARNQLKECCDVVVGSKSDHFLGDKVKKHHHVCVKCGKRFPVQGSYDGDFVNDDLTGEAQ